MVSKKMVLKDGDQKERLFFHDIVNLTHGLLLFLQQKKREAHALGPLEIELLEKEVRTLQGLIKDHYHYRHKNLIDIFEWIPLSLARPMFDHMVQVYLGEKEVVVKGDLPSGPLIYGPAFYRILNNLVKNIAETDGRKVEFIFHADSHHFFLSVENDLTSSRPFSSQGLGLESIQYLSKEAQGEFFWESTGLFWKSSLTLPLREKESKKIPA